MMSANVLSDIVLQNDLCAPQEPASRRIVAPRGGWGEGCSLARRELSRPPVVQAVVAPGLAARIPSDCRPETTTGVQKSPGHARAGSLATAWRMRCYARGCPARSPQAGHQCGRACRVIPVIEPIRPLVSLTGARSEGTSFARRDGPCDRHR